MASTSESTDTQAKKLTKADFESSAEVRWCPGCGDYSVLAAVQKLLPTLNTAPEDFAFISGIGCSSRFPYYMNCYGFHTIHGRAPAVATGTKIANPDLSVWVITGDGDALSIGGNHLVHVLRRNVDLKILLFNNQIYGLTKGQYSPTSELGKVTKSTPMGSTDFPLKPLSLALGVEATFVARTVDNDAKHMGEVLKAAAEHKGAAFVEIYQNCVIFNDDAFAYMSERGVREDKQLQLRNGELLVFGKERNRGIRLVNLQPEVIEFPAGDLAEAERLGVLRYDNRNQNLALILSRLDTTRFPVPMGVLYQSSRPVFNELVTDQVRAARDKQKPSNDPNKNLSELFQSGDTWTVS